MRQTLLETWGSPFPWKCKAVHTLSDNEWAAKGSSQNHGVSSNPFSSPCLLSGRGKHGWTLLRSIAAFLTSSSPNSENFCENFEIAAVRKYANLVELEKCCQTHIFLQNLAWYNILQNCVVKVTLKTSYVLAKIRAVLLVHRYTSLSGVCARPSTTRWLSFATNRNRKPATFSVQPVADVVSAHPYRNTTLCKCMHGQKAIGWSAFCWC